MTTSIHPYFPIIGSFGQGFLKKTIKIIIVIDVFEVFIRKVHPPTYIIFKAIIEICIRHRTLFSIQARPNV